VISGRTRVAGVIGDPVRHSLSPALHNAAYDALGLDWAYVAFEVAAGAAAGALVAARTLGLVGLSVTMPHKAAAADACDELTSDAAQLHSVNTVTVLGDGRLRGDSTDGEGFVRSLRAAGHEPNGRKVLLLGAGGAARAVSVALHRAGAHVQVAARRPEAAAHVPDATPVAWDARNEVVRAVDVVVNATPIGMGGDPSVAVGVHAGLVVADLVYHPLDTPLLRAGRAANAETVDGLGMLVHQAALQVEQWSGRDAPVETMRAAALRQLRDRDQLRS
jgi:shikimate dehydrogenase